MRSGSARLALAVTIIGATLLAPAVPAYAGVTSEVVEEELNVFGDDADDSIEVTCFEGDVKVNGSDPGTGAAACSAIVFISVSAGGGNDEVTLAQVDPSGDFSRLSHSFVDGGAGDDVLVGSKGGDTIAGQIGADALFGGPGDDLMKPNGDGGSVDGGAGEDQVIVGGTGSWKVTDLQIERLAPTSLVIPLVSIEAAEVSGGTGNDRIDASEFTHGATLLGLAGDDRLTGGRDDDGLRGGSGDDRLRAGGGDDALLGGPGRDVLRGQQGPDFLNGGGGVDDCRGGPGRDFLFKCA